MTLRHIQRILFVLALLSVFGLSSITPSVSHAAGTLILTEISPSAAASGDWFEIYNTTGTDIDLSGYVYDDNGGTILASANIASGVVPASGTAILIDSAAGTADAFKAQWGAHLNVIEVTSFSGLGAGGDSVALWSSFASYNNRTYANALINVAYLDNSGGWPDISSGISIRLNDVAVSETIPSNWTASTLGDGLSYKSVSNSDTSSPGLVRHAKYSLQLTEISASAANTGDWFEIYNPTPIAIDLTGFVYDDNGGTVLGAANIASGSVPAFGTAIVIDSAAATETTFEAEWGVNLNVIVATAFSGLSASGDSVALWDSFASYNGRTYANALLNVAFLNNASGWPSSSAGVSIRLVNLAVDETTPSNWATSVLGDGISFQSTTLSNTSSPGVVIAVPPTNQVPTIIGDGVNPLTAGVSYTLNDATQPVFSGTPSIDPQTPGGFQFTVADADNDAVAVSVLVSSAGVIGGATLIPSPGTYPSGTAFRLDLGTAASASVVEVTITADDGTDSTSFVVQVAVSDGLSGLSQTTYHTRAADASSALNLGGGQFLVLNDEDQSLRVYEDSASGWPVLATDITSALGLSGNSEVDFEASAVYDGTFYISGSHSNNSSGQDRPNRSRLVSVNSSFNVLGYYSHLKTDLLAWDSTNAHGLGANFLGLTASAAIGVIPESNGLDGFNIEGLAFAPTSSTAYVGFRAPLVNPNTGAGNRTHALIIPVTNYTSLAASVSGGSASTSAFGAPIFLDLGGRGVRSIECVSNGCIIIAGSANAVSDFAVYTWSGNPADAPKQRSLDLSGISVDGSPEGLMLTGSTLSPDTALTIVTDNGDKVWYPFGALNGIIAKDLSIANHRKFRVDRVTLGSLVDEPAILVTNTVSLIEGSNTDITVSLNTQPLSDVVITVTPLSSDVTASPTSITLNAINWATGVTVSLTGVEDTLHEGVETTGITLESDSIDSDFDGLTASSAITITDNDTGSVMLSTASLTVIEGGAAQPLTVMLTGVPSNIVTVTVTGADDAQLSTSSIELNGGNWSSGITINVSALADALVDAEIETLTLTAESSDPLYDGLSVMLAVQITDSGVNLLTNSGFESGLDAWTGNKLVGSKDRVVCNTATKTVTPYGVCAFRLIAASPLRRTLTQIVPVLPPHSAGDSLTFSAKLRSINLTKGAILVAQFLDGNGTVLDKLILNAPVGTKTWLTRTATQILTASGASIKVMIKSNSTTGKLFVDDLTLFITPAVSR